MKKLRQKALALLARREYSSVQLASKLRLSANEEEVSTLLAELMEAGWQSDARFAESFIHARTRAGYGPLRIKQELKQRGIANSLIEELLPHGADYWQQHLQAVWQKKYHNLVVNNKKEQARQIRFLLSRGFEQDWVMKLLLGE